MLNEGNQIQNFICSSGSDFLTSYGSSSGSIFQKVTVSTVPVPVPQRCSQLGEQQQTNTNLKGLSRVILPALPARETATNQQNLKGIVTGNSSSSSS